MLYGVGLRRREVVRLPLVAQHDPARMLRRGTASGVIVVDNGCIFDRRQERRTRRRIIRSTTTRTTTTTTSTRGRTGRHVEDGVCGGGRGGGVRIAPRPVRVGMVHTGEVRSVGTPRRDALPRRRPSLRQRRLRTVRVRCHPIGAVPVLSDNDHRAIRCQDITDRCTERTLSCIILS